MQKPRSPVQPADRIAQLDAAAVAGGAAMVAAVERPDQEPAVQHTVPRLFYNVVARAIAKAIGAAAGTEGQGARELVAQAQQAALASPA